MTLGDAQRWTVARDAAVQRWADAAGDRSLCRPSGTDDERAALKRLEGAATALREVVRDLRGDVDAPGVVDGVLQRWEQALRSARDAEWRAYAEGGRDALVTWRTPDAPGTPPRP